MAMRLYTQPYSSPMMRVWISLVTCAPTRIQGERRRGGAPPRAFRLRSFGVLVDQRTGDVLVFELVAAALDLGQIDRLVGPVVAGGEGDRRAEAGVEVGQGVDRVLQPLSGHLETEALQGVAEDGGADETGRRPGRVVDLRVVLLDDRLVGQVAGGVHVVGHPVGGGDGSLAVVAGEVRGHLEVQARRAREVVLRLVVLVHRLSDQAAEHSTVWR